jgi:hypothetical protein
MATLGGVTTREFTAGLRLFDPILQIETAVKGRYGIEDLFKKGQYFMGLTKQQGATVVGFDMGASIMASRILLDTGVHIEGRAGQNEKHAKKPTY